MKKFKPITIRPSDNGIIVVVGCAELVFQMKDFDEFHKDLDDYIFHTEDSERRLAEKYGIDLPEGEEIIVSVPQPTGDRPSSKS